MGNFFSFKKQDQGTLYKLFFDASSKRTLWEAIIFYILQVISMYVVILVISRILDGFMKANIVNTNISFILIVIVVIYVVFIYISVLREKKLLNRKQYLLIVAFAAVSTYFFGGLVGLLPVIYFAMLEKR